MGIKQGSDVCTPSNLTLTFFLSQKLKRGFAYSLKRRLCMDGLICAGEAVLNPVAGLDSPELRGEPGDNGLMLMGDIWLRGERSLWEVMKGDMLEPLSLAASKRYMCLAEQTMILYTQSWPGQSWKRLTNFIR